MSQVAEAAGLEAASSLMRETYRSMRIDARGQQGGIRLVRESLGPVQLDHATFAMNVDITADPPDAFFFCHLIAGLASYDDRDGTRSYRPGQVFRSAPPAPCTASIRGAEIEVAVIPPEAAARAAATAPGRAPQPLRFTGYAPVSEQAAATWKATRSFVGQIARDHPDAAGYPLVAANAAQMLVAAALSTFPSNAVTDPTIEDRHDAHPATLRRGVAFIDEHAHEDISLADIAAAANITIRAVQLAFRRHLDTTPLEYLRRVRLDHAHRDLLAADPAHDSVTAVACRWGFSSPSRFAAYYRQAYGVSPGRTLRD